MRNYTIILVLTLVLYSCGNGDKDKATISSTADGTSLDNATLTGDEKISTSFGALEIVDDMVTDESSQKLFYEMDLQRAAQAYMWSTPIVSFETMKQELHKNYGTGDLGKFVVLESFNEKQGVVTGNLTTPYIFSYYDLSEGPLTIDYPAGQTAGGALDLWQRPVFDLGLTGPDAGKGAKYIIVGPEDDVSKFKKEGDYTFQSATNFLFIGIRILDPDPAYAKKFKSSLKMGKVDGELKETTFIEGLDKKWSGTSPRGLDYWKTLSTILNNEPVREVDKAWMAMLEPLGIRKGVEFNPDDRLKKILKEGAALGELMTRNIQINPRYTKPYWDNTYWYKSFDFQIKQETDYKVQLDERATWFYEAITSTKGMVNPEVGKGQVYMTSKRDKNGDLLRADKTYKLHVPKDVPAAQFWSVTLYSENTRRPYENGGTELSTANLGSRSEQLQRNEDGSVDIYIGTKAPDGKESNYLKTVGDNGWFIYFRLYAPTQPFFDKTFTLPDWELVNE